MLERGTSSKARRSLNQRTTPLSAGIAMARTRGVFAGAVTVTVLVPAHNEETSIFATLSSLLAQSNRPERVVVVADNCTDGTVDIARSLGVEIFESRRNTFKKAGALNQILKVLLPGQGDNDLIMVLDADTRLDDGFLEAAVGRFTSDRALMAVGGLFSGEEGLGLLGQFQRNEYIRYSRDSRRRRGQRGCL
ncbi:glycosyltransferase family 2 protein [Cryobacterium sp. Sr3]|uniref:glycosyltransferase family 2 protein n=1 Tax=Cryobacterium sp. Sr3 TaxID=1259194 RepID=UPI001F542E07|nr:glycosyltransferase family 2 protein [Cryobacterium sp. Sr3]